MAKKKVEVSESASVGDEDLGASAETHAGASAEVTDSSAVSYTHLTLPTICSV